MGDKSAAMKQYETGTAAAVLEATRRGSAGLPLLGSTLGSPGSAPVGLRAERASAVTKAYKEAAEAKGIPVKSVPVALGRGRKRKTAKGKKRTGGRRKTRSRK